MLTVLGGLAEFERELIRARTDEGPKAGPGSWSEGRAQAQADATSAGRGVGATREPLVERLAASADGQIPLTMLPCSVRQL